MHFRVETAAAHPVSVSDNRASETGGGIYLKSFYQYISGSIFTARALLCANDFQISENIAKDGSGIFADQVQKIDQGGTYIGGSVSLNVNPDGYCAIDGPMIAATHCIASASCNAVSAGIAADANGVATEGAAIKIAADGRYFANDVQIAGNRGGYAMQIGTNEGVMALTSSCLIADNIVSGSLIRSDGNSPVEFDQCTFAHNTIGSSNVFELDDDLSLLGSIISQPGKTSLRESNNSATLMIRNVIANEVASLDPTQPSVKAFADARFIDPAHGDYHLQAASPAVDFYAAPTGANARDLDGNSYMIDLPLVANRFGASDLGAYERQAVGNLVLNGAFDKDLRLWTIATTSAATFDSSKNVAGALNSGSVYVDVPRSSTPVRGLSQCVHVPGPGTYQLNASAFAPGNFAIGHDSPSLYWRLRFNDSACSGPWSVSGVLTIPGGSTSWHQALAPANVAVTAGQWTANTTVEIALLVTEGNDTLGGDTVAWFDGVILIPQP